MKRLGAFAGPFVSCNEIGSDVASQRPEAQIQARSNPVTLTKRNPRARLCRATTLAGRHWFPAAGVPRFRTESYSTSTSRHRASSSSSASEL